MYVHTWFQNFHLKSCSRESRRANCEAAGVWSPGYEGSTKSQTIRTPKYLAYSMAPCRVDPVSVINTSVRRCFSPVRWVWKTHTSGQLVPVIVHYFSTQWQIIMGINGLYYRHVSIRCTLVYQRSGAAGSGLLKHRVTFNIKGTVTFRCFGGLRLLLKYLWINILSPRSVMGQQCRNDVCHEAATIPKSF
jgi:hypothetical protein